MGTDMGTMSDSLMYLECQSSHVFKSVVAIQFTHPKTPNVYWYF